MANATSTSSPGWQPCDGVGGRGETSGTSFDAGGHSGPKTQIERNNQHYRKLAYQDDLTQTEIRVTSENGTIGQDGSMAGLRRQLLLGGEADVVSVVEKDQVALQRQRHHRIQNNGAL